MITYHVKQSVRFRQTRVMQDAGLAGRTGIVEQTWPMGGYGHVLKVAVVATECVAARSALIHSTHVEHSGNGEH